eukprot:SAG11_NODE_28733_length_318_cov_1.178082_1_plen_63_part_01
MSADFIWSKFVVLYHLGHWISIQWSLLDNYNNGFLLLGLSVNIATDAGTVSSEPQHWDHSVLL